MEDKLNNVTHYKLPKHFNYEMNRWFDILFDARKRIESFIKRPSFRVQFDILLLLIAHPDHRILIVTPQSGYLNPVDSL